MERLPLLLARALRHHKAGQLSEAEQIYREILAADPAHVDALHHLGVIATQLGKHQVAIECIRQAIAHKADVAAFHYNLGCACRADGQLAEAIAAYQEAVRLKPVSAGERKDRSGRRLLSVGPAAQSETCFGELATWQGAGQPARPRRGNCLLSAGCEAQAGPR
jgi:tetratricopeptide (TPR) repeat protein